MTVDLNRKIKIDWFTSSLLFLFLLKIFLAFNVPILADEAYYVFWGTHPAGGYYDLPPMIGWWEQFITYFSLHPFLIRLPNLLVTTLVALGIYDVLKVFGRERARWVSAIYFVLPLHLLSVIVSPDVPLVFFSFFAVILFFFSDQKLQNRPSGSGILWMSWLGYFLSGSLWGAAFLSKYFAVMMLPGVFVWILVSRKTNKDRLRGVAGLTLVVLGALPFLFQHLWWNSQNCWANFVFNLVTRHTATEGSVVQTFGLYLLYLLVLVTPVFLSDLFRSPKVALVQENEARNFSIIDQEARLLKFCFCMWSVPIGLFGVTALLGKGQGLHWYLSYTSFFVMWLGLKLSEERLKDRLISLSFLSGSVAILACLIVASPQYIVSKILHDRFKLDIAMSLNGAELSAQLAPFVRETEAVMSNGYVFSSVLDMHLRRYSVLDPHGIRSVGTWGTGSRFGRVFDWINDFKALDGKSILVFSGNVLPPQEFNKYFESTRIEKMNISGADYYLHIGTVFKARDYHTEVLIPSFEVSYPSWHFYSACPVKKKVSLDTEGMK